jgi:anti-anti-sigma factor
MARTTAQMHTGRTLERTIQHVMRRRAESGAEKRWGDPPPPPYEIQRWEAGTQAHLVVASGELDLHAAPAMRETLTSLAARGHTHLVIDMSAATFIDSAMIGVLTGYLKQTRGESASLAIVCSNENVLRTIRVAGLEREVQILKALSDAVVERVATIPRVHPHSNLVAAPRSQSLKLVPHASELAFARGFVIAAARRAGLDPQQQYNLALAANEALANAIEHGCPCRDGMIEMWVDERGAALTVGVRNRGDFILEPLPPDPLHERGRGLRLMKHMVDEISLEHENSVTTVQLSIGR